MVLLRRAGKTGGGLSRRTAAAEIVAEARERATAEATRISEQAQAQIAAERQQAAAQLKGEVGSLATTLAGKIVGASLEDDARSQRRPARSLRTCSAPGVTRAPNSESTRP